MLEEKSIEKVDHYSKWDVIETGLIKPLFAKVTYEIWQRI